MRAEVLIHGATGFTGKLVAEALAKRGIAFAVGGRNPEKLAQLARALSARAAAPVRGVETAVIDVRDPASIARALEGRKVVLACAGPFIEVGEPMLAAAARAGVHYADTTGEQSFVALASERHHGTAEASGACIAPAMAYEIAPADWAAHVAAQRLGDAPESIDIVYMLRARSSYGATTTRGTKRSMLAMMSDRAAQQFVDGALRREPPAEVVRSFGAPSGRRVTAASFPSPEAIVVPRHTGARTVRTFMVLEKNLARMARLVRRVAPPVVKAAAPLLSRFIEGTAEGPGGEARNAEFDVLAEARRGPSIARVFVSGHDPYGLTAEIQALFAARVLEGRVEARGVVAPSMAISPNVALEALRGTGLALSQSI